ncbi:MAG: hypothetical protein ACHRHE_16700 [Tepidisphaerales bacterium]
MNKSLDRMVGKLEKVADVVADEKPRLRFFGLVHRITSPWDRWDLLVCSDKLAPRSIEAIRYILEVLKAKKLTREEMIRIARIVVLPRNNELIAALSEDEQLPLGKVYGLHSMDDPDTAVVIRRMNTSLRPAKTA